MRVELISREWLKMLLFRVACGNVRCGQRMTQIAHGTREEGFGAFRMKPMCRKR